MKIYLIRHGQSEDDERGVGQTLDTKLSQAGIQKLIELKKSVYDKIKFDLVYYSPQARAKQTAKLLFPNLDNLQELDYIYEYKKPSRLYGVDRKIKDKYWQENRQNKYDPDWQPEDGESFNQILDRVKRLAKLLSKHQKQTIGIVGHGVFFKHLVGYWKMGDKYQPKIFFDKYQKQKIENGSCIELKCKSIPILV